MTTTTSRMHLAGGAIRAFGKGFAPAFRHLGIAVPADSGRPRRRTDMAALSDAQRHDIEQRLQQRERALRDDIHREMDKSDGYEQLAGEVPDPGDAATADQLIDTNNAEIGRDLGELRAVSAALRRIHEPDFGLCIGCGVEIPFERLQANPSAQRCFACQELYEHTHRGQGPGPTL
jgi:RNA polymerase-binding protein DksA